MLLRIVPSARNGTSPLNDTVGELDSVDQGEEKRIGWTKIESKTISAKEIQPCPYRRELNTVYPKKRPV